MRNFTAIEGLISTLILLGIISINVQIILGAIKSTSCKCNVEQVEMAPPRDKVQ